LKFLIAAAIAVLGGVIALSVLTNHEPPVDAGFPVPSRSPSPTRTPAATATPTPRAEAARGLEMVAASCAGATANSARAVFLWAPSHGGPQFVDLSIFNDGFAPGTFISLGGYARDRWGLVWEGLLQGTTHYARINTLTSQGWKASETVAFFTPVCNANAYYAYPGDDMWRLRDNIAAAIDASGIDTAVAITDLRTGETVDVNGSANRLPGCTVNLFALMRVVQDLQHGVYAEPEPGDLIGQTINRSDPVTSRTLVKYWLGSGDLERGLNSVNDFVQSLGMASTLMDHPPAFPGESLYGYPTENRITALDANLGLRAIWDGRVLNAGWRDYFLRKMTLVKPGLNYLIPVGTSYGATVSHKNGFLYQEGWADNDIGIVWYERGGQRYGYAISFFTEGVPVKYGDIPLGQSISSMAYQWFVARYGYP
jgi:beta-lactamase class A